MRDLTALRMGLLAGLGMLLIVLPRLPVRLRPCAQLWRDPKKRQLAVLAIGGAVTAGAATASMFGVGIVSAAAGILGGVAVHRVMAQTQARREAVTQELWPELLDTLRVDLAVTAVPLADALFAAARRLPPAICDRFATAERQWQNTLDVGKALDVLAARFDDATTDVVCASLRTVTDLPGVTVQQRLADLSHDLRTQIRHHKDAEATLAGARFARRFVVIVPVAMALVGSVLGDGRSAYASPAGQTAGLVALAVMIGCWWWASRLLRVPEPPRVFRSPTAHV